MTGASERAFRVLLRLYPPTFRERFEPEMVEFFRIRSNQVTGVSARARFACRTLVDVLRSALRERRHGIRFLEPHTATPRPSSGGAFMADLRQAGRLLVRQGGFTAIAALTLALGIGATVSVYSLAHAMFLKPLPFREADRLVSVWERRSTSNDANLPLSGHEFAALRDQALAIEGIALYHSGALNLTGAGGDPEAMIVARTSANFFTVAKLEAAIGRVFADGEDGAGATAVAILSDALWRRRFAADRAVIGRDIVLDDRPYRVIGILAPVPATLSPDVWLPLDVPAQIRSVGRHNLQAVARLAPGVTVAQAQAEADATAARLARELPRDNTDHQVALVPVREDIAGTFRTALRALLAAVGCVLLIGCANVANLLLTRGAGRQREIAVRMALGASRLRIVRQLLAESVVLAAIGGTAGVLLAAWVVDLIPVIAASRIPLAETARIDWGVLAVAVLLTLAAGLAAGLAPALRSSRAHPESLREGMRTSTDPAQQRLRSALVAAEIALTLILLVGTGLLINSFVRLMRVDPGFDVDHVLVFNVDLPGSRYPRAEQCREIVERVLERVRALPGVIAAGAISQLPLGGADNWLPFSVEGRPTPPPGQELNAAFRAVTPDYFRALGIPLRAGRFFSDADARISIPVIRYYAQQPLPPGLDRPQPPPVVLVSEAAGRRFWPGEDPIGQHIRVLVGPPMKVVGIVGDVRHHALNAPEVPHVYLAHNQEPWNSLSVVVRTSGDPLTLAPAARDVMHALDPALPVGVRAMADVVSASLGEPRFYVLLIAVFGGVAIALATVGVFGVVSYAAAQRTREIGVRLALGAQRREIVRLMIGQGLRPILTGLVVGAVLALYLTRFIETMLFGIEPTDVLTFASVLSILGAIAVLACWFPAQRASKVDPVVTLRTE